MFEKISRAAEKAATSVARRDFLGGLGKAALGAAAVVGGLLAFPGVAQSAGGGGGVKCCGGAKVACAAGLRGPYCQWLCNGAYVYSLCSIGKCPIPATGCVLVTSCICV